MLAQTSLLNVVRIQAICRCVLPSINVSALAVFVHAERLFLPLFVPPIHHLIDTIAGQELLCDQSRAQLMPNNGGCPNFGNFFGTGPQLRGNSRSPERISGMHSRRGWSARIRDAEDGMSDTVLIGEMTPA